MTRSILYLISLLLVVVAVLSGCGQVRHVPVESVRIDYRDVVQTRIDSVHILDSIFVHTSNDTVYQTRWRTMLRERKIIDTLHHIKVDTVTRVVEVEKPPTLLHRLEYNFYRIALVAVLAYALVQLIKRLWRGRQ